MIFLYTGPVWFHKHISDLDATANDVKEANKDLKADHPVRK